jgi:hypothetical protein
MQQLPIDDSARVSQNKAEETLAPAEQPESALAFTPVAQKDQAPGLAVRTQLKAGYFLKID